MNKYQPERKTNNTFPIKPTVKILLQKISQYKKVSMAVVLENMIVEKAKRLGIELWKTSSNLW